MITRLVQAPERVSNSGGHSPKPDKLRVYYDYDLWEDRMKANLEAVDEGACPATILGRFDKEVYTVARDAKLTAALTPATIFKRLRREFGRSSIPWVARVALKNRRTYAGESVVEFQRHLCVLARQAYPNMPFTELEARILENFVDGVALPEIRIPQLMSSPWDSARTATSALRRLNSSGALLSPLLLGTALRSPPLLGEALHSLLDMGTGGNNVVVRPTLRLHQVFM
ncbi:unnamed protein product [Schistocephalus solidus]|uniref:Uncharacterized protein n=1 Tax=Schistocephalus solidus TaxID=70667 RepID=A0A183TQB0_SCHSO|nr:unnamed protein product [Schistocephalus solidus]